MEKKNLMHNLEMKYQECLCYFKKWSASKVQKEAQRLWRD